MRFITSSQNLSCRIDKIIQTENLNESFQDTLLNDVLIQNNLSAPDRFNKNNTSTKLNLVNTDDITDINVNLIDNAIDFNVNNLTTNDFLLQGINSNDIIIVSPDNITEKLSYSEKIKNELETIRKFKRHLYLQDQSRIQENLIKYNTVSLDSNQVSNSKFTVFARTEGIDKSEAEKEE